jgi:6-phosphofructokinase 1
MSLKMLQHDVEFLKKRYSQDVAGKSEGRLVIRCVSRLPSRALSTNLTPIVLWLRSEKASKTYTTEVVTNIFAEEGQDLFDSRFVALGHTLQGGVPSPRDRTRAIRLTVKCIDFLEKHHNRSLEGLPVDAADRDIATIVIEGAGIRFAPLQEMVDAADFKNRRGKVQWWAPMKALVDTMAGRVNLEEVSDTIELPRLA